MPAIEALPADRKRPVDYTTAHGDWPAYGGGLRAQKYSPLDQISADNIDELAIAWVWEAFDNHRYTGLLNRFDRRKTPDGFKATPLMVAGRLFVRTAFSAVAAIDPITGETLWTYDPGTGDGPRPPVFGFSTRGLAYHRGDDGDRVLLVTSDGWLIALSAETGKPLPDFGEGGRVDLTTGLRRPLSRRANTWNYAPALCGDVVVLGNQTHDDSHRRRNWRENVPLGDVRGFDVGTGRQVWVFKTIPQAGEFGNDTWGEESWKWMGNTNVWSMMSCDPELGDRLPAGHRAFQSLLRRAPARRQPVRNLRGRAGRSHGQAQVALPDRAPRHLGLRPARGTGRGRYRRGRQAGTSQWPKSARSAFSMCSTASPAYRCGPSKSGPYRRVRWTGEQAAATQPVPTWPPPFEMQGLAEDDLIDFTPELRRKAQKELEGIRTGGLFLPPSTEGSLAVPGWGGGANWGGAAFDPGNPHVVRGVAPRTAPYDRPPGVALSAMASRTEFGQPASTWTAFPW